MEQACPQVHENNEANGNQAFEKGPVQYETNNQEDKVEAGIVGRLRAVLLVNHPRDKKGGKHRQGDPEHSRVFVADRGHHDHPKNADQQGAEQAEFEEMPDEGSINAIIEDESYRHEDGADGASDLDVIDDIAAIVLDECLANLLGI